MEQPPTVQAIFSAEDEDVNLPEVPAPETEEEAMEKAWDELEIEDSDSLCYHCEEDMLDHPMIDFTVGLSTNCLGEE